MTITAIAGDVRVNGYYRRDGTYVQPYMRSAPDSNTYNNWYTGKPGTINPVSGYHKSLDYQNPPKQQLWDKPSIYGED